jgi:hypothetical protein
VIEHRGRQQVTVDNFARLAGGTLNGRLRLEERWRDGVDGAGLRVRPYVKFTRPFTKGRKTALVLTHESFVNLDTTSFQATPGYERMRNLVGISTPLSKTFATEIGYLNQHRLVRGGEDMSNHVLSLAVSASF